MLHTYVAKRVTLKHLTIYTDENELCEMNSLVNMIVVIIFQSMHMANHNIILFMYNHIDLPHLSNGEKKKLLKRYDM